MKARSRPAVMSDVARLAGVSHQTVSRVINGSDHVREETRERVMVAMRQLDYRPNSVARALVTGRSKTFGVVSLDTTLYGPASTLFGIEQAAHEAGYFITIASMRTLDRDSVLGAIERLRNQGVDGIIVIAPQVAASRALLQVPPGVPLVALEAGPADAVPVASIDQHAGAAAATSHLLSLGHETVWHIAGPEDWVEAQERMAGWRETLEAAGIVAPAPLIGDWSPSAGYDFGRQLAARKDVTAIFVANDQMSLGVLRAMHEAGRDDPRERQHRRLRRRRRGAVFHAAADDGAAGLRRDGPAWTAAAAADDGAFDLAAAASRGRAGARRPRQHRAAAGC